MAMLNSAAEVPPNINISAYRVLFILLMLVRYRSLNSEELNRFLIENPRIRRHYNPETLTKYINTLREVGCCIPRSTSRNDYSYELLKNPFPLHLEPVELQMARKLLGCLAMQPDELLYQDYRRFLENLLWAAGVDGLDGVEEESNDDPPLPPELARRCEQWQMYQRYCREEFTLEIQCQDGESQEVALLEPHEVIDRGTSLFLLGLDRRTQKQRLLPTDSILSVKQLPAKNQRPASQTIVTFALYGRLAKSYRLYPNEKVIYQSKTELHIKVQVSDTAGLMARLLKYGASCQVLSPETLRDAMRHHIRCLLDTLQSID